MRLVDSHAHLQADAFAPDRGAVIAAARDAGVCRFLVPGWDVETSQRRGRARRRGRVHLRGCRHPSARRGAGRRRRLVRRRGACRRPASRRGGRDRARLRPRVLAAGRPDREPGTTRRARAGARANRSSSIAGHGPASTTPRTTCCELLESGGIGGAEAVRTFAGRPRAILHSFSGPVSYGERALELGCAVSFSGLVFRRGEEASAEVARLVPDDRLLVETDCPWLSPPGAPRRRNEPRWVEVTARWLAERREADPEALGERLVANFDAILGLCTQSAVPRR